MTIKDIKVGVFLTAINPCRMEDYPHELTLSVGRSYEVIRMRDNTFKVIDDYGEEHGFDINTAYEFFKVSPTGESC